jgi:hypothetical protein
VEESKENKEVTFDAGPKAQFPEMIKIEPCSSNECLNGHKWQPQLALAQCPGCGGPILMVRMVNCPVCNEPTKVLRFRTDHTNQGFGIAALCRGQRGMAESNMIEMTRGASQEVEKVWDEVTGRMPA